MRLPWMARCGVRFQPSLTGTLNLSRTNAFFLGGGKALLNAHYATAERLGVEIMYDTEVRTLAVDDGFVRDIEIVARGFPQTIRARAVVVSCGGFQGNIEWLREYWGPAADNFLIRGTSYAQGLVLRNLLAQGVAPVGDPTQCHAVAIDARSPKYDGGIVTRLDCVPFSIVVNRDAQRFYDEGEDVWPKRYAIWGRLVAQQPDQIAYSIIDAKSQTLFMPSVFPAIRADTIEDLAGLLKLDPAKPGERRSRHSTRRCGQGVSTVPAWMIARPKGSPRQRRIGHATIDTPPFFAYPLRPGITFTYLGVRVNERAQVLMQDGRPLGEPVRQRRDHGRQRSRHGLSGRLRHDDRHRVRPHRRKGSGRPCHATEGPHTEAMQEARREMEICNACRYCEGYCAVFPAMTLHRSFADGDLNYLANLCHGCRGCYYACQYAPPHEFGINLPRTLAEVRQRKLCALCLAGRSGRRCSGATAWWCHWPPRSALPLVLLLTTLFDAPRHACFAPYRARRLLPGDPVGRDGQGFRRHLLFLAARPGDGRGELLARRRRAAGSQRHGRC